MKHKVNRRIRIKHKPFMSKRHYLNKCIGCKYHESSDGVVMDVIPYDADCYMSESDVPDNYFDDVCTYPYTDKCMKTSWSYRLGTVIAVIVLLILLTFGCACLYWLCRIAWFLIKFVMNLVS